MLELGGLGVWGHAPLKIDAKMLQYRDIFTYIKCFYSALQTFCNSIYVLMERISSAQTTT